jgi:hypothetical protein
MARRRRQDMAQLILNTGVEMLIARGLDGGCDHVGMSDVLAEVERTTGERITNASVYGRMWDTQADFHRELLLTAAEYYPAGEEQATQEEARAVLAHADLGTMAGRTAALVEISRTAGAAHLKTLSESRPWQTWLAIWAITVSTPTLDDDNVRGPAIARRHHHAVNDFADVLDEVLDKVGYTVKAGLTLTQLASSIYALSEGFALHDRFAPEHVVTLQRPSGPVNLTQEPAEWTLFSVGVEALLLHFTEPNPPDTLDAPDARRPLPPPLGV